MSINRARLVAIFFTIVWIILLIPFIYYSLYLNDLFKKQWWLQLLMLWIVFLPPLSIPVSIFAIWYNFFKGRFKEMYACCWIPLFFFMMTFAFTQVYTLTMVGK